MTQHVFSSPRARVLYEQERQKLLGQANGDFAALESLSKDLFSALTGDTPLTADQREALTFFIGRCERGAAAGGAAECGQHEPADERTDGRHPSRGAG